MQFQRVENFKRGKQKASKENIFSIFLKSETPPSTSTSRPPSFADGWVGSWDVGVQSKTGIQISVIVLFAKFWEFFIFSMFFEKIKRQGFIIKNFKKREKK